MTPSMTAWPPTVAPGGRLNSGLVVAGGGLLRLAGERRAAVAPLTDHDVGARLWLLAGRGLLGTSGQLEGLRYRKPAVSGGLIGCMHAVGATGIMQTFEIATHIWNR